VKDDQSRCPIICLGSTACILTNSLCANFWLCWNPPSSKHTRVHLSRLSLHTHKNYIYTPTGWLYQHDWCLLSGCLSSSTHTRMHKRAHAHTTLKSVFYKSNITEGSGQGGRGTSHFKFLPKLLQTFFIDVFLVFC